MPRSLYAFLFIILSHNAYCENKSSSLMQYPNALNRDVLIQHKQAEITIKSPQQSTIIHSSNLKELRAALLEYDSELKILTHPQHQQLIIYHSLNQRAAVQSIIETFQSLPQELSISCAIYELSINHENELNLLNLPIESGLTLERNHQLTLSPATSILDQLQALEKTGNATLISEPTIRIQNNSSATFIAGQSIPYVNTKISNNTLIENIHHIQTGLTLTLTPTLQSETHISCKTELRQESVQYWKQSKHSEFPVRSHRSLTLSTLLPLNTPTLIAQFKHHYEKHNTSQLPFSQRIPILNKIFGHHKKEKKQTLLCIFITPKKEKALE